MKRILAAALSAALCLLLVTPALCEDGVSARTLVSSAAWEKTANLELAAQRLDGTVVPSGASFSFNAAVGERSVEGGFRTARDGAGVLVSGGGVEQAATTLYLALNQLGANICFDEKHSYGEDFADSYVPDGANAIRVDGVGDDFRFTNLGGELTIRMTLSEGSLLCSLSVAPTLMGGFLNWSGHGPQLRESAASASIALKGSDAMVHNIELAASSVNDTLLRPGDFFSFNDTVGPRSERFGYQRAVNGRGVDVVGGGVAQVASVLWLAVKNLDGIAIVEKSTYGNRYNQSYVTSSNDAILTDYEGRTDFSFRNAGDSSLTLSTYVRDGVLYCEIYRD